MRPCRRRVRRGSGPRGPGRPLPSAIKHALGQGNAPIPRGVLVRDPDEPDRDPDALAEEFAVLEEKFDRAGADGAETDERRPDRPRGSGPLWT